MKLAAFSGFNEKQFDDQKVQNKPQNGLQQQQQQQQQPDPHIDFRLAMLTDLFHEQLLCRSNKM